MLAAAATQDALEVSRLLREGADPLAVDERGRDPLMSSMGASRADMPSGIGGADACARRLIPVSDLRRRDARGMDALAMALGAGRWDLARELIPRSDLAGVDAFGRDPLHHMSTHELAGPALEIARMILAALPDDAERLASVSRAHGAALVFAVVAGSRVARSWEVLARPLREGLAIGSQSMLAPPRARDARAL